jgi:phosphatidylserine decarboxylase
MFHKEGYTIILITSAVSVIGVLLADKYLGDTWYAKLIMIILIIVLIAVLQFFRNPKRNTIKNKLQVIAPVDGKVVVIEEVEEPEYFKGKRRQISIFMSPLNVHVTRYCVGGTVKFSKYHPGKYLVAWHPKASTDNERTTIVIENETLGEILYRQIAGAIAKRIVNYAKVGDVVEQGKDAGFIKFGSRVDIFLPLEFKILVSMNQKVKGGVTVIAEKILV